MTDIPKKKLLRVTSDKIIAYLERNPGWVCTHRALNMRTVYGKYYYWSEWVYEGKDADFVVVWDTATNNTYVRYPIVLRETLQMIADLTDRTLLDVFNDIVDGKNEQTARTEA